MINTQTIGQTPRSAVRAFQIAILLIVALSFCSCQSTGSSAALVDATQTQFRVFESTSNAFEKVIRAAELDEAKREQILEAIGNDRIAFGDINVEILRLLKSQVGVSEALTAAEAGLEAYLDFKAKLEAAK